MGYQKAPSNCIKLSKCVTYCGGGSRQLESLSIGTADNSISAQISNCLCCGCITHHVFTLYLLLLSLSLRIYTNVVSIKTNNLNNKNYILMSIVYALRNEVE